MMVRLVLQEKNNDILKQSKSASITLNGDKELVEILKGALEGFIFDETMEYDYTLG